MTIRRQMIVVFGLVAFLPLLLTGFLFLRYEKERASFDGNSRLVGEAGMIGTELDAFFQHRLETARQNGLLPPLVQFVRQPPADRVRLQTEITQMLLAAIVDDPVNVSSCALLDSSGVNVSDIAPERRGRSEANEPWFLEPMRTGLPYVGVNAFAGETAALWVAAPLRDSHGTIHGVLRLRYEVALLKQMVATTPNVSGGHSVGAIFDRTGAAVAYSEGFRVGPPPRISAFDLASNGATDRHVAFWTVWSAASAAAGERDRVAAVLLRQMPLWVTIAEPESLFLAQFNDLQRTCLFLGGLVCLLVVTAVIVMARRISKPVTELAAIARLGASGDLNAVASEDFSGELGGLARDFNRMTIRLRGTLSELGNKVSEVQTAESRARELVESSPVAALVYDSDQTILQVNRRFTEIFGYDTGQLHTLADWWLLAYPDPERRRKVQQALQARLAELSGANQMMRPLEAVVTCRNGNERPIEFHRTVVGDRTLVIAVDLTERRAAEQALRASEERFRLLLEHAPEAVVVLDVALGRYVDCNRAAEQLFQLTRAELLRLGPVELSPTRQADGRPSTEAVTGLIASALEGGQPVFEWLHRNAAGRDIICEVRLLLLPDPGGNLLIRGSIIDISARVEAADARLRLEQQLWHAQKLEAVGTLAGGIAHDFNNILVGVIGNLQLAVGTPPDSGALREYVEDALRASLRARDLVGRLLAVTRQKQLELRPTQLEPVVREAIKLVRASLPPNLTLETDLHHPLPPVLCDSTQIHQIVVNLVTNAAHAMAPRGGTVSVRLEATFVDAAMQSLHPQLSPGHFVCLTVHDTGCGMDAATLARIFDPFFTTKPVGEGSGLGLAVVHGIVRSLHGAIVVESTPGSGTTFRVYLPVTTPAPLPEPPAPSATSALRGARIAIVDDDVIVRKVLSRCLQQLEAKPEEFPSPTALLNALREDPGQFDVVITDYAMPETNGVELAGVIHELSPSLRIVLTSGNTLALDWTSVQAAGVHALLDKPFTIEALDAVLTRVLTPGGA